METGRMRCINYEHECLEFLQPVIPRLADICKSFHRTCDCGFCIGFNFFSMNGCIGSVGPVTVRQVNVNCLYRAAVANAIAAQTETGLALVFNTQSI